MRYLEKMEYLQPALDSKLEEFWQYGYDITMQQLWTYCVEYKWASLQIETMSMHHMISSLFRVNANEVQQYWQLKGQ